MSQPVDFFTPELARRYDERNQALAPISGNLHFLIQLVLESCPTQAKVLSVGAGTGAEVLSLAKRFEGWSFVLVEPSLSMLNIARERLSAAGIADRCEFIHGYVEDTLPDASFDVVLAVLVGHFVKREHRLEFYKNLAVRLRNDGILVNAEISYDLKAKHFPLMLKNWESVQRLMGGTPESLATLPKQLNEVLTVLTPEETENLIDKAGAGSLTPVRFFQAFMITAWWGRKIVG